MPFIFIIDDDNDLLKVVSSLLRQHGYEVAVFNDWEVAKNTMRKRQPDMILLDVFLTGIDGLDVCQRFKACSYTRNIPILLFSGYPHIAETGIDDYGAADFLAKPFEVNELIGKVQNLLSKKRESQKDINLF